MQPIDLVKIRLQAFDFPTSPSSSSPSTSTRGALAQVMSSTYRHSGIRGFYQGLAPSLLGNGSAWGIYFYSYRYLKQFMGHEFSKHINDQPPTTSSSTSSSSSSSSSSSLPSSNINSNLKKPSNFQSTLLNLICAAQAGAFTVVITNPIWVVKTRMQLQDRATTSTTSTTSTSSPAKTSTNTPYRGMINAFQRIYQEEGIKGFYRGLAPAVMLVSNGAIQFMIYEELRSFTIHHITGNEQSLSSHHFLIMGALAKMCSSTLTYPIQVVRTRMYKGGISPPPGAKRVEPNIGDIFRHVWRTQGWRGFYRGLPPALLETAPASALVFFGYETSIRILDQLFAKK